MWTTVDTGDTFMQKHLSKRLTTPLERLNYQSKCPENFRRPHWVALNTVSECAPARHWTLQLKGGHDLPISVAQLAEVHMRSCGLFVLTRICADWQMCGVNWHDTVFSVSGVQPLLPSFHMANIVQALQVHIHNLPLPPSPRCLSGHAFHDRLNWYSLSILCRWWWIALSLLRPGTLKFVYVRYGLKNRSSALQNILTFLWQDSVAAAGWHCLLCSRPRIHGHQIFRKVECT